MLEVNNPELRAAASGVLQAAILGHDLSEPLQRLASAGRSFGGGFIRTTKNAFYATPSVSLTEFYRQFQSGMVPTDYNRLIHRELPAPSFERDLDPSSLRSLKNAFYEEFCRPNGMARGVRIRLLASDAGYYRFNFFRDICEAPFEAEELRQFDAIAPFLDATAAICQTNFEKQTKAKSTLILQREFPAFALARDGRVTDANEPAHSVIPDLLCIVRGRLTARLANEQKRIDVAIQSAVSGTETPAMVRISGTNLFSNPLLLAVPINGPARDVFASTAAFVVVVDAARKVVVSSQSLSLLASSLSLTGRESDVMGLVAAGQNLKDAARQLNIGVGTARGHLKAAMQKTGVHSQVELAALVAKLNGLLP
jgi:DNA-binding CsgD family transcriptional regulator